MRRFFSTYLIKGDDFLNTTGFIRGYMSKNMKDEDFIKVVAKALSREFEEEVHLINIDNYTFTIRMMDYQIILNKRLISTLKSPYGIDRFILEQFESQGFKFDRNRSQYIQYCFC